MAAPAGPAVLEARSPAGRWTLTAMILGSAVVGIDATVVNVALPRMGTELDADFVGLQWIVTGYTLTLAALILAAGALGDRYGRRRVFCVGVGWFAVASAACAVAPNVEVLVAGRALQGVGGALLTPGSLAIISATFRPPDRARAIGTWSGLGGVAVAVGPFLGGLLVELSWRWIFLVNLPLAAIVLAVTLRHVPESRDPDAAPQIDVPGMVLAAVGLAGVTYGLTDGNWQVGLVGVAALVGFGVVEARSGHPMLPMGIFADRVFSATNVLTFVVYAALGIVLFLLSLVLQEALGYSPLAAGGALFPATVLMLLFSSSSGALAQRIGPRLPLTAGPLIVAVGLLMFLRVRPGTGYPASTLPAVLVFGAGLALMVAPLTATVLAAADPRHAGVASGINNAVARAAGLIGIAGLPMLVGIDPGAVMAPVTLLAGFHRAMVLCAGLCAAGAVLAWFALARVPTPGGRPVAAAGPAGADAAAPGPATPGRRFSCGVDAPPLAARPADTDVS